MKLIIAFLKLIRSVNLLFIALTQVLFHFFVIVPLFDESINGAAFDIHALVWLVISSVLIAAAGYIINDYFDLNIDRVNKPSKMVIDKTIKRRWAIIWHILLSISGILIGAYLSWYTGVFWIVIAHFLCVMALWFYSTTFKKKVLSGNIIISLLTAWVVLVPGLANHYLVMENQDLYSFIDRSKLLRLTFLYAGFAFIISLVREVIKDVEDMEGDMRYGCRTMPIAWGVMVSKVFAATWLVVLSATIIIVMGYMLQLEWWLASAYCLVFLIVPLARIFRSIQKAATPADYHRISNMLKFVMFTGILSLVFLQLK